MNEDRIRKLIFATFVVFMVFSFIELFQFHLVLVNTHDISSAINILHDQDVWIVHVFRLFMGSTFNFKTIFLGLLSTVSVSSIFLVIVVNIATYKSEYFKKIWLFLLFWIVVNLLLLVGTAYVFQMQMVDTGFGIVHGISWICLIIDGIASILGVYYLLSEVAK